MQNARNKLMDAVHSQRTRLCKTQNVIMRRPNCAGDVRAIPSLSSKMTAPCGLDRCTFSALTLCACDRNRGDRIATAAQPTFRRCNSNYIFQQRLGVFRTTVASTVSPNAYTYLKSNQMISDMWKQHWNVANSLKRYQSSRIIEIQNKSHKVMKSNNLL